MPTAPTSLALLNQGVFLPTGRGACVKISWTGDAVNDYFIIEASLDAGVTWGPIGSNVYGTTQAKLFGLTDGASYKFRVKAKAGGSTSAASNVITVAMAGVPLSEGGLATPGTPTFSGITATSGIATWTDSGTNEAFYQIGITPLGGVERIIDVTALELSWNLTGLRSNTAHAVRVRTVSALVVIYDAILNTAWKTLLYSPWCVAGTLTTTGSTPSHEVTGPLTLTGRVGTPVPGTFTYTGADTMDTDGWSLAAGPAGLTIASSGGTNMIGVLGGTPTAEGIFDAIVTASTTNGSSITTQRELAVRIIIEGENFLGWFHDNPANVDLQVDIRTRLVKSRVGNIAAGSGASGGGDDAKLTLTVGDTEDLFAIFRDGQRLVDPYAIEQLVFMVRLENNFDFGPILKVVSDPAIPQLFSGHATYPLTVWEWSPVIERLFAAANSAPSASATSARLTCRADIRWKIAGVWKSSHSFYVNLRQPYSR